MRGVVTPYCLKSAREGVSDRWEEVTDLFGGDEACRALRASHPDQLIKYTLGEIKAKLGRRPQWVARWKSGSPLPRIRREVCRYQSASSKPIGAIHIFCYDFYYHRAIRRLASFCGRHCRKHERRKRSTEVPTLDRARIFHGWGVILRRILVLAGHSNVPAIQTLLRPHFPRTRISMDMTSGTEWR